MFQKQAHISTTLLYSSHAPVSTCKPLSTSSSPSRRFFTYLTYDIMRREFAKQMQARPSLLRSHVKRYVTYSCLSPGDSGISLQRYAIPLSITFFIVNIFRLEKFSAIFYSLTLLIMLLLHSIPHFLISCFINTSFSTPGIGDQPSVRALFPRCLFPSNIADIALPRKTPPIAAILESLMSSRSG